MSTTLISYNAHGAHDDAIGVFPTLWRLRVKFPDHPRSFRAPWAPIPSIWLTILVLFASVQLVAPGLGSDWFGDDFRPSGWAADEKWTYLLTEAIPLITFVAVGALFYVFGARTRRDRGSVAVHAAEDEAAAR